MMRNIQINIRGVSKTFPGVVALDDVSVDFSDGNLYGVIGPAGAGKTTLFRIMLALMVPNAGGIEYRFENANVGWSDVSPHIAYMPQSQSLYSDLSVDEHLEFFRDLYGIGHDDFVRRRDELLQMTRMGEFANRPAGKLSGGMYKKLGLMCALLRSPRIMLLDEPTNGVDPISRREFWALLNRARRDGILVIISTAYMDEAERCDNVVLMDSGRIIANGEPRELLVQYGHRNFDELFIARRGEK